MTIASLGTTKETTRIMRLLRNRTKAETKDFMDDFTNHLKIVLDTLEGQQKVFWLIESDIAKQQVTIRLGSTLGISDLPPEVYKQFVESEKILRAQEDGDGKSEVLRIDQTFLEGKNKPLHITHCEAIKAQHDADVKRESEGQA